MKKTKSAFIASVEAARKNLEDAQASHQQHVQHAEQRLQAVIQEYQKTIQRVQREKDYAIQSRTRRIGSFQNAVLFANRVESNGIVVSFEQPVQVNVTISGTFYTTQDTKSGVGVSLGGAVLGGVVAGPMGAVIGGKKDKVNTTTQVHDNRVVYITVTAPRSQILIQAPAGAESQARAFANLITNTYGSYEKTSVFMERLRQLDLKLESVRSSIAPIRQAEQHVNAVCANDAPVRRAQNKLASILASASPDELAQLDAHDQAQDDFMKKRRIMLLVILVVLGLGVITGIGYCSYRAFHTQIASPHVLTSVTSKESLELSVLPSKETEQPPLIVIPDVLGREQTMNSTKH
ncbi:hypothetical protein [Bifidobacterium dolichotidis]|nr:hypothetical protein [Bifidobacterium dolichotidis]